MSHRKRMSSKKKVMDDERSLSRSSSMADLHSEIELKLNKPKVMAEYREIKMSEIMSHYKP